MSCDGRWSNWRRRVKGGRFELVEAGERVLMQYRTVKGGREAEEVHEVEDAGEVETAGEDDGCW